MYTVAMMIAPDADGLLCPVMTGRPVGRCLAPSHTGRTLDDIKQPARRPTGNETWQTVKRDPLQRLSLPQWRVFFENPVIEVSLFTSADPAEVWGFDRKTTRRQTIRGQCHMSIL